jgi:hypothetical protein
MLWIPLALYVGMTVVLPALNGAASDASFVEHAAVVLGAVGVVALLARVRRRRHLTAVATSAAMRQPSGSSRQTRV